MKTHYQLKAKGIFLFAAIILLGFTLRAQQPAIKNTKLSKKEIRSSKLDNELIKLHQNKASNNKRINGPNQQLEKYLVIKDGFVVIDITAKDNVEILVNDLRKLGMKDISTYGRNISGFFPIDKIDKLSSAKSLKFARPSYKPKTHAGRVTSQGDTSMRSYIARKSYKVNGKGITVGVLSDSYNALKGADSTILTDDLPGVGNPKGHTTPVKVLEDATGTDEGRAMLEIIHDVAPGAKLAFNTANLGMASFANGILNLAKTGSDVIVDDIIYLAEPMFQDGIIAQAVDEVSKKGVVYLSSAGNQARASYEHSFKDSKIEPLGPDFGSAHDFGKGDIFQQITIEPGGELLMTFQWDDSFFSASGKGAKTDLDIFLLNEAADSIITASYFYNIDDDPVEVIYFENLTNNSKYNIMITKSSGPAPKVLKYIEFSGWTTFDEYATNSSTIFGHSNSKGAISVGAARYHHVPEYGINPPRTESFTSAGGTKILFDTQGNRIKPIDRKKPEITAPDGGNTTFFIPGLDYEDDGYPNFFGTSASAPHAAAVVSLMLQAKKKCSKADILWALEQSSIDIDDPFTPYFDLGFDYVSGSGLIQADLAIGAILRGKKKVNYLALYPACSNDPALERRWKIKNPNNFPVNVTATIHGEPMYVLAKPGETYFTTPASEWLNIVFLTWLDENGKKKLIANYNPGDKCKIIANARLADSPENEFDTETVSIISAFPNPVSDKLKIQLVNTELQNVKVILHNTQGQKIYDKIFNADQGEDEIDMSSFSDGLYILKINHDQYSKTLKILKQ